MAEESLKVVGRFRWNRPPTIYESFIEEEGIPVDIPGFKLENYDTLINRIEQIIMSGTDPRIPVVNFSPPIVAKDNQSVIIINISKSWIGPHMVTYKNLSRIYARNNSGKFQLDIDQIKEFVTQSQVLREKIDDFRTSRIIDISAANTPTSIQLGPIAVLHLIPLNSFQISTDYDLEKLRRENISIQGFRSPDRFSYGKSDFFNFEGLVFTTQYQSDTHPFSYIQFFRNGIIEAVSTHIIDSKRQEIPAILYEAHIIEGLERFLDYQKHLGVSPPIIIANTLLNVEGFVIRVGGSKKINKNNLIIPPIQMNDFKITIPSILKPIFDRIWNASGEPGSHHYDIDNRWNQKGTFYKLYGRHIDV